MAESAADRAIRLIDLVPFLHKHPGSSLKEVAREFNISASELLKDLDLLFMCGLPGYTPLELIDLSVDDGIVSLREPQNLDAPRRFSQREALVIRLALSALAELLPMAKRTKVASLIEKLTRLYANEIPVGALYLANSQDEVKLEVVKSGFESGMKLEISYLNSITSDTTDRKISVLRIIPESNRTLIEAWCEKSQGVRTFNLANIKAVTLTSEIATARSSQDNQESFTALLEMPETSAFYQNNKDQLSPSDNGYSMNIYQSEWLIRNVLAQSGEVSILAPNGLRSEIVKRSKEALRNYSI